jgi:hypothetical protein
VGFTEWFFPFNFFGKLRKLQIPIVIFYAHGLYIPNEQQQQKQKQLEN